MKTKILSHKFVVVGIMLVISITGFIVYPYFSSNNSNDNAIAISDMDYDEIQEQINQQVEEGKINVQYQMNSVFRGQNSEDFLVRNIKNNHFPIKFKIYNEKDQIIYHSSPLERGYEIHDITLNKPMEKGEHNCKIEISYVTKGNISSRFPLIINVI